ncbi:MAG: hypothetical protein FWD06_06105 [Oscillospiraceae bacterium]|nr:hypothetical protein [Oscillospiraceae bacterium]
MAKKMKVHGGCAAAMECLSKTTKEMHGKEVWKAIFKSMPTPMDDWTPQQLSDYTREIEKKYLAIASREQYECAQKCGNPWVREYKESERKHLSLEEIDALIANENARILEVLRKHHASGELFYSHLITDAVMADYESGRYSARREGRKILLFQIPHMWDEYLSETNPAMKRYCFCHCCWAKESILTDKPVSPSLCYCSLGHSKRWLDDALGRQLDGRVLCSVLDGCSTRCNFEVHIPDDVMEK